MSNRNRVAKFDDYHASDGIGDWNNGIIDIALEQWNKFHGVIAKLFEHGDFIWRGQTCDWPLKSKFDRMVKSKQDRETKLVEHKSNFLRAIKGRRGNNPPQLENPEDIWAIGQHFGLATPLLDWTESPFVAAYFAFREKEIHIDSAQDNRCRFVFGLNKDIRRWGPGRLSKSEPFHRYINFVESLSDFPRI